MRSFDRAICLILDFCPRPARKEGFECTTAKELTVLIYLLWQKHNIYSFLTLLHKPQCLLYRGAGEGEPVIYLWGYLGLCPVKLNNNTSQFLVYLRWLTLISLINVKSRLPILKNSTLHKKIPPPRLLIS